MRSAAIPLVSTIKERCRVCYTCVRECPAKAIRIADQQAEVIVQRCIGCGNCVRVCSQKAKRVLSDLPEVRLLLAGPAQVAAIVAPSFPAEFHDLPADLMVGMLRQVGFAHVHEVGFGADLVARAYRRLLEDHPQRRFIATTCPAVVAYVERYQPELVDDLVPIVSPMIAMARVLRELHGDDVRIVFIGPCIAKKEEARDDAVDGEIDAVLTFKELYELFDECMIEPYETKPAEFDPPWAGSGALFPVSSGMLQAAHINEDLAEGKVVAAHGSRGFVEAIREFGTGDMDVQLLEVLSCQGCIMGPGMTTDAPLFRRRARISRYVRSLLTDRRQDAWRVELARYAPCDLGRTFERYDQRVAAPRDEEIIQVLQWMGKYKEEDELNCGACGYETCREHAIAICKGLAESEMCLPFTIDQLRVTCRELTRSHERLATTQEALMQSEKLASMGQLAAGIAHEVNNPLGTVLMLAHVLMEEAPAEGELHDDLSMIAREADRCKRIVSGLLHFARRNKVEAQITDLRALIEHTLRALAVPANVTARVVCTGDSWAEVDRDQIQQVLTNLITNALAAMPQGGVLEVSAGGDDGNVVLSVRDTGTGIAAEHRKRIFEPFFSTKPAGEGTGLGLSVTYGIIKMHRGDIRVESNADPQSGPTGTTFTVTLPRRPQVQPEEFNHDHH